MTGTERPPNNRDQQPEEASPPRFAEDQFYRALAAQRRRRVLYYVLEEGDSTVAELATVPAGWEATTDGTMKGPEDRRELRLELVHKHLPCLADAGLITYDVAAGAVQCGSFHEQVAAIIRQSIRADQPADS